MDLTREGVWKWGELLKESWTCPQFLFPSKIKEDSFYKTFSVTFKRQMLHTARNVHLFVAKD